MQCEAVGLPSYTTKLTYFAELADALEYANSQAEKYEVQKTLVLLHDLGVMDLNAEV